ncbi:HlyD family type I secretion periplasmic adaptor subunit [Ottowia caeni]|uniref:HlyD family type I secretion periplasmic adaptor subunit n=1 Tax=Ottowia caeni TaxID=2870339 RepID=UPI001E5FCAC3|nr:HlyD family type I secretion periplasmic adaptor subunit [Ottowia caeni]
MNPDSPETTQRHPAMGLLARYRAVFRAAWAHRAELAGPRRQADEAAFLPAALSLQETPVHPAPRRLAWIIMVLFLMALAWAILGSIDIVAVAPGRIIVSDRTKVIQPLERSVVRRILVKDGDRVIAGQTLVELDPTAAQADRSSLAESGRAAQSEWLRTRALLNLLANASKGASVVALDPNGVPADWNEAARAEAQTQLSAEWSDITARLARFSAEHLRREAEQVTVRAMIGKIEATLPIARQREQDFLALTAQGFMSGHASQDRIRERIELERDLATQYARLQEAQASLREAEHARRAYLAETVKALNDRLAQAELKRHQASQEMTKAMHRELLTTLVAPVAGTVQQLAMHTEGGVVTEAQPLLVIVPDGAELSAEVMLENKDIGFVEPGQEVALKLETFPFTRYGIVKATVDKVSQDAVSDEKQGAIFPAALKLSKTHIDVDGKRIRLAPGMNVTAEIKTGKRRLIEYLLSSIQRAGNESLRER